MSIPAITLVHRLVDSFVELHGFFQEIGKTMLDAANVLTVISKEITLMGGSVSRNDKKGQLRLDRESLDISQTIA